MPISTLSDLVFHVRHVAAGRPELLSVRHGARREALSAADFLQNVHSLALALEARGLEKGERVAILSENRPEWHTVDFACQLLGATTVPIFPALPSSQVGFILRNSGCRWVFYSDRSKLDVLTELEPTLATSPFRVAFESEAVAPDGQTLTRLQGDGAAKRGEVPLERFRGRVDEEDLASLLYTSGTTGDPKGVMLTHRNVISNFLACGEIFDLSPRDSALSFLPLSHGLQRTLDHLCFFRGVTIHYVPSIDEVRAALAEERPTVLVAMPAIYERVFRRIREESDGESTVKQRLFRWAVNVGRRHTAALRTGVLGPLLTLERRLAESLIFRPLRRRFGGRLRLAICGGAPLLREVSEFFEAVGVPIFQGYGLAETSPLLAASAPERHRPGSVGKALSSAELRVAKDGEILARGPAVMRGYWQNPSATAASLDDSGWLHTGDVGSIDRSGYIFVTDRKRHLIRTEGGGSIAPQPIEKLLTARGLITQAVVVGDGRPHLAALLVPDFEGLAAEYPELGKAELVGRPEVLARVAKLVDEVSAELPEAERPRAWRLLAQPLSAENGEITHTGKIRRRVVNLRYAEEIAGLYAPSS